ncbi:hypothetical protein Q8A67_022259 [Cirrhinus molitorella]|uniref:Uncharacterized protein n=1 Tax=Cirrhinus molitorella TaxID=172907 RepID=A0AA88P1J1_9TELE|nr:hypothetical protein Q8A67_022259 [Cirrhinus molitorella]
MVNVTVAEAQQDGVTQDIPFLLEREGQKTYLNVIQIQTTTEVLTKSHILFLCSSQEVVIIYIFRSLPFICLLVAFFYLNRDDKRVTTSKPAIELAVESGEGLDEDLDSGETQRNENKEVKRDNIVSEQEKERVNNEKPEVTAATEEGQDEENQIVVIVNNEQGTSPMDDNENKTVSVLNTDEKTRLMAGVEESTVSVLGDLVSAL